MLPTPRELFLAAPLVRPRARASYSVASAGSIAPFGCHTKIDGSSTRKSLTVPTIVSPTSRIAEPLSLPGRLSGKAKRFHPLLAGT